MNALENILGAVMRFKTGGRTNGQEDAETVQGVAAGAGPE